jgi:hypothetical protein
MSAYLADLHAGTAMDERTRLDRQRADALAARERLTPLEDRVARLLASIPVEVQREGLSLPQIQKSLRGRWRGHCHPGELGEALRRLGFVRERRWHKRGGFRALWFLLAVPRQPLEVETLRKVLRRA